MSDIRCNYFRDSYYTVSTNDHKLLCVVCAIYCCNLQESDVKEVIRSANSCECYNHNQDDVQQKVEDCFQSKDIPLNSIAANNVFLRNFEQNMIQVNKKAKQKFTQIDLIQKEMEKRTFFWENIQDTTISEIIKMFKPYSKANIIDKRLSLQYTMFESAFLDSNFSLSFILKLTEFTTTLQGTTIYDRSQDFYTLIYGIIDTYHFQKDFCCLEKIDAECIEKTSPLYRQKVRRENLKNEKIRAKYFNEQMNIKLLIKQSIDVLVPASDKLYVTSRHKHHVYIMKLAKTLAEYGLLQEKEMDELLQTLASKVHNLVQLEKSVQKSKKNKKQEYIDSFRLIREYVCEFAIHVVYQIQDIEFERNLRQGVDMSGNINTAYSFDFLHSRIYQSNKSQFQSRGEEVHSKLIGLFLGQVISSTTIDGQSLVTQKVNNMADNFIMMFASVDDPYLFSLQLLSNQEIKDFLHNNNFNNDQVQPVMSILDEMLSDISNGRYALSSMHLTSNVLDLFEHLNKAINYKQFNQQHSFTMNPSQLKANQQSLLFKSFLTKLFNLLRLVHSSLDHQSLSLIYTDLCDLLSYMGHNNTQFLQWMNLPDNTYFLNHYCLPAVPIYFFSCLDKLTLLSPKNLIKPYNEFIISHNRYIHYIQQYSIDLDSQHELKMLHLRFLKVHLEQPTKKITVFDVEVASLIQTMHPQDLMADVLDPFVALPEDTKQSEYFKILIILLTGCFRFRITSQTFDNLMLQIPMDELITLINSCDLSDDVRNNLSKRSILTALLDALYSDPKDKLIDNRHKYVFQSEKYEDQQIKKSQSSWKSINEYVEDPLYDCGQNTLLTFIGHSVEKVVDIIQANNRSVINLAETYLFGILLPMAYKVVVRLYHQRNLLLPRVTKYLDALKELNHKLFLNSFIMIKFFDINPKNAEKIEKILQSNEEHNDKNLDPSIIKFMLLNLKNNLKTLLDYVSEMMDTYAGHEQKKWKKHVTGKAIDLFNKLDQFDTRLKSRKDHFSHHSNKSTIKSSQIIDIVPVYQEATIDHVIRQYVQFKVSLFSINQAHNTYLQQLQKPASKDRCYNLMNYLYNEVNMTPDQLLNPSLLNYHFLIIGCMSQFFFFCTKPAQIALFTCVDKDPNGPFLNTLWFVMLRQVLIVKGKRQMDRQYKQCYEQSIMILKLFQFMMQQHNLFFKDFIGQKPLIQQIGETLSKSPSRLTRLTTIIDQLCIEFNFHIEYKKDSLKQMATIDRPDLYYLATQVMSCINECISGTHQNRLVIYSFIGDKLHGLLNRYEQNQHSYLYQLKNQVVIMLQYFVATYNPVVLHNVTINYELQVLNDIVIKGIRQLFFQQVKQLSINQYTLDDIGTSKWALNMKDFNILMNAYRFDNKFQKSAILTFSLNVYILIKNIAQKNSLYAAFYSKRELALKKYTQRKEMPLSITEEELVCYRFIQEIIEGIEIVDLNSQESTPSSVILYYAKLPKSQYLPYDTLQVFLENVDRSTPQHKLNQLVNQIEVFEIEMKFYQNLIQKRNLFSYFSEWLKFKNGFVNLRYITFIVNLTMNLILLFTYQNETTSTALDSFKKDSNFHYLTFLAVITIILSTFASFHFLLNEGTIQIRKFRLKQNNDKVDAIREKKYENVYGFRKRLKKWNGFIKLVIVYFLEFLNKKDVLFIHVTITTILGLFVSPFFFCLTLLSVTSLSEILQLVRKSIVNNSFQLFLTYSISVIFCYIYAFVMFKHYQDDALSNCDNLHQCFIQTITIASRNGIGVSELMKAESFKNQANRQNYNRRFVFEITFWLIVNVIILNVLSGIIIDSFSTLRLTSQTLKTDQQNVCYICALNKNLYDSYGVNFQQHIDDEHKILKYVNFIIYMKNKTINDCTSQEIKIYQSIKNMEINWFPLKMCLSIKNLHENNIAQEIDHKEISKVYSGFKKKISQVIKNDNLLFQDIAEEVKQEDLEDIENEEEP